MLGNKILQRVQLTTITKGDKPIRLSAAVLTQSWRRPSLAINAIKDDYIKAILDSKKPLPDGTTEIALR